MLSFNTDKMTEHSYLGIYQDLFNKDVKRMLEIGVFKGGSIEMFCHYFKDAIIDCIDIDDKTDLLKDLKRVNFYHANAYDKNFTSLNGFSYDLIVDDGPHTLESQKTFINKYVPLLAKDGVAVIEDLQSPMYIHELCRLITSDFDYTVHDLRAVKNRHDDIALTIKRK